MSARMKPILGAFGVGYIVSLVGNAFFFGPILANDMPTGPVVPGWLALLIFLVLFVILLDQVTPAVGSPVRAALIIAVSQILLVDVYYILIGNRGVAAAAASAILLLAGSAIVGSVYGRLSPPRDAADAG